MAGPYFAAGAAGAATAGAAAIVTLSLALLADMVPPAKRPMAIGIWGGALVGVDWKGVDGGSFWSVMQNSVSWQTDILNGIIKSVVFAVAVVWIALFNGYDAVPTSEGISRATTKTVVHASLTVLALDFVLTAMMFGGN